MKKARESRGKKKEYLSPIVRELQFDITENMDEDTLSEIISVITTGTGTS